MFTYSDVPRCKSHWITALSLSSRYGKCKEDKPHQRYFHVRLPRLHLSQIQLNTLPEQINKIMLILNVWCFSMGPIRNLYFSLKKPVFTCVCSHVWSSPPLLPQANTGDQPTHSVSLVPCCSSNSVISFNLEEARSTVTALTDVTLLGLLQAVVRLPRGNYSAVSLGVSYRCWLQSACSSRTLEELLQLYCSLDDKGITSHGPLLLDAFGACAQNRRENKHRFNMAR